MFTKLFFLSTLCVFSAAAPLPRLSVLARRDSEGPGTDANGYRCTQHYTVRPFDTCASVGMAFGLQPAILVQMNTELECDSSLKTGQRLCVQTVVSGNPGRSFVLNGFR
ncbi:hypothetical protein C8R46DRAFT_1024986 [Mycena filopes]|nr:hypothetical protein C8R46DRAFT_1024986 [Mycena filopes]